MWWTAGAAFLAYLAVTGVGFLVSIRAADHFGLGPTERGLLLAGFGLRGVLAGRPAGDLVDRSSAVAITIWGALACALIVPLLGLVDTSLLLAAVWLAAGVGSALIWAGLNTLAVQSAPENRGGAISVVGAFKFTGSAVAPLVWLPIYLVHVELAFAIAGVACAAIALVAAGLRGGPRRIAIAAADRARTAAAAAQQ